MFNRPSRLALAVAILLALSSLLAYQSPAPAPGPIADPFATGWMLTDTNGDDIADFIAGKVIVPSDPTAAENAAAADLAARLAYGTTGLSMPVVIPASDDHGDGP